MKKFAIVAVLLLCVVGASAATMNGPWNLPPSYTVATLPTPAVAPWYVLVTDLAANPTDCATGSGSGYGWCVWDGSAWHLTPVPGTSGGGGGSTTIVAPQGRLTLQSGTPVMTADQAAKTTIYYDSFAGNQVPHYNGTAWSLLTITGDEVSTGLDNVTHIVAGSVYDIFAVSSSGSLALCAGPAWSSTTSRGTGAGTTAVHLLNGLWTNTNALTHCWGGASGVTDYGSVAANQGTYLGTFYATSNGQTTVQYQPGASSGGTAATIGLWNAYNRVPLTSFSRDNKANWSYASTTWRALDNSTSNRITFVDGLQQSWVSALLAEAGTNNNASFYGIDLDSTTATPGNDLPMQTNGTTNISAQVTVPGEFFPQLGLHYVQAMEAGSASQTSFAWGNPATQYEQFQLRFEQ